MRATVYSGPHYGRSHEIRGYNRHSGLVEVRYRGDKFFVPAADVEGIRCGVCRGPLPEGATSCLWCSSTDYDET